MAEHGRAALRAYLTASQVTVLAALVDCIVPRDDFPSGTEAGVLSYLAAQFSRDLRPRCAHYRLGLDAVDAEARTAYGRPFVRLQTEERNRLLQSIEAGHVQARWPITPPVFFADMVGHVMEGFYGDPGNGGNRGAISWQMIGFRVTD